MSFKPIIMPLIDDDDDDHDHDHDDEFATADNGVDDDIVMPIIMQPKPFMPPLPIMSIPMPISGNLLLEAEEDRSDLNAIKIMSSEHDHMPQYDKLKWIDFDIVDDNDDDHDHDHKNDDGDDGGGSYDDDDDDDNEKIYSVDGYISTSSIKQIQKIKWTNQEVC